MRSIRVMACIAMVALFVGVAVVGDALAGEKGKTVSRIAWFASSCPSAKVADVEGHAIILVEAKGIIFDEKWGAAMADESGICDYIKGAGPNEGYDVYTFSDGSTIVGRWKGSATAGSVGLLKSAGGEGTWSYVKGTGKFEGIQGGGTYKYWVLGPGRWYAEREGEYTIP